MGNDLFGDAGNYLEGVLKTLKLEVLQLPRLPHLGSSELTNIYIYLRPKIVHGI